jgi:hypothetical protein
MAKVLLGDKYFFIDKSGNRMTPEFEGVFEFHEELAAVVVGSKVGYIRRDGTFAIPAVNGSASGIDFSEGVAATRVKGKVGFMDKTGAVVIEPQYDDVFPFSDGFAAVQLGDRWGYIDHAGKVVIPIKFHIGHMFSEGVASVELEGKWGFVGPTGRYVIPPAFEAAMPFCGGVAAVETYTKVGESNRGCRGVIFQGKHGVIDHSGKYVWRDAEDQMWPSPFCD